MPLANANRIAAAVVAVGIVGLAVVLGLWQRVDAACGGDGFDPEDPVSTCQAPADAEVGRVSVDPLPVGR